MKRLNGMDRCELALHAYCNILLIVYKVLNIDSSR